VRLFEVKKARPSFLKKGRPARGSKKLLASLATGGAQSRSKLTRVFLVLFLQKKNFFLPSSP
jgi:hypothetical protein